MGRVERIGGVMGYHLNKILGVIALTAGLLALTGILFTDTYLRGAQIEASGNEALDQLFMHPNNAGGPANAVVSVSAGEQQKAMQ